MSTRIIPGLIYGFIFSICAIDEKLIFINILLIFFLIQTNYEFYKITERSKSILLTIIAPILYLLVPIIIIKNLKLEFGSNYLLFILFITWINDISAYIIGKKIGKTKLSKISPKKTIEGFLGSIIICMITCNWLVINLNIDLTINSIFLAFIISISCNSGDLIESLIKRKFHKKDSGYIMGGHGGILDRLDSLLIAAPVFYIIVLYY